MSTARHVDATNPEKVRVMLATGSVKDGETTLRTVCQDCRAVIVDVPAKDGRISHGLCGRCYRMFMAKLACEAASSYAATAKRYGSSPEADEAYTQLVRAIYDIVDCPSENGPDRDASQRVGSDRSRPSGDDTRKLAGRLDRSKPYMVTVGSPGGVADERYYADFAAMVAGARELAERYPHPERQIVCANWDRADLGDDGLSDAERELLEELL